MNALDRSQGGRQRLASALLPLLLLLLAVGLRAVPDWSRVIEDGHAVIRDPDACYHLRRAELMSDGAPTLALFDTYLNHPAGAHVIWPPLYDLGLALLVRVAPGDGAAPGPGWMVALLPPLLAGLTVLVLFALARRSWPGILWPALVAAGIAALLPADQPYTRLGQLDHHALELLITLLFVHLLAASLEAVASGRRPRSAAILPALVLAAGLLVQLTLLMLVPIACLAGLAARRIDLGRRLALLLWLIGVADLLVLPWALAYHLSGAPVGHAQFGVFQVAVLGIVWAVLAALALLFAPTSWARGRRRVVGAVVAILAAATIGVRILPEGLGGLGFLLRSGTQWIESIAESRSLLDRGIAAALREIAGRLSLLALLLPVGFALQLRAARGGDVRATTLCAAALILVPLAFLQARFMPHVAWLVAFMATATIAWISGVRISGARISGARISGARISGARISGARSRRRSREGGTGSHAPADWLQAPRLLLVVVPILLVALWPTTAEWRSKDETWIEFDRARPVLAALAASPLPLAPADVAGPADLAAPGDPASPVAASDPASPAAAGDPASPAASGGVLAEWSFGHFIQYHGHRPAVVDNFGDHAGDPARARRVLLDTDGGRAYSRLQADGVDHVLVRDLARNFLGLLPTPADVARFLTGAVERGGGRLQVRFKPAIGETVLYRLAWQNGAGLFRDEGRNAPGRPAEFIPPLHHFRLVAESAELEDLGAGKRVPWIKLYQVVPGATLRIEGRRFGEAGGLFAAVRTPRGSVFPFTRPVQADQEGVIEVVMPYPTEAADDESRLVECLIRFAGEEYPVRRITRREVEAGAVIALRDVRSSGSGDRR